MKIYKMTINQKQYEAKILEYNGTDAKVQVNGVDFIVEIEKEVENTPKLVRAEKTPPIGIKKAPPKISSGGPRDVVAPIPGTVHAINVSEGDSVKEGDVVLILEAMKMESDISAPGSGKVKKIRVKVGDSVQEGQVLVEIGV